MSTAIGENNKFLKHIPERDEDGYVKLGPRNFYTKKGKKGAADDIFLSKPSYICVGDPFRGRSA